MKAQSLFHSFLPSVTVAVLTTQTAWADTIKLSGDRLLSSPNTFTSTNGSKLVANNFDWQLGTTVGYSFSAPAFAANVTSTSVQSSLIRNVRKFILAGTTGVPVQRTNSKVRGISRVSETTNRKVGDLAKFLQPKQVCPDQKENGNRAHSASLLINPPTCQRANTAFSGEIAQADSPTTQAPPPAPIPGITPITPGPPPIPVPGTTPTTPTQPPIQIPGTTPTTPTQPPGQTPGVAPTTPLQPITPITPGTVQVPLYLRANPNPLQFPTRPAEVRIEGIQPLTLQQALELARLNSRQLQQQRLVVERSESALREARAELYPNVAVTSSITRQQSAQGQLTTEGTATQFAATADEPATFYTGQAQVNYAIYTSGARAARIRQAQEQLRADQLTLEDLSDQLGLTVATNYYDLQQADQNVRIARVSVTNSEAALRDAQALEQAGVGTRFDVLQAQVNLANAQQQLTNALATQQIAVRQLAETLSLPQSISVVTAEPVKIAGLWNLPLAETIVLAFQNRPDLQQFLAQRNIFEQVRREALAALGPQLNFVASYDLLDEFDDRVGLADGYAVALQASLLVFDGGAARARAEQARANIRIAESQFAQQREAIRFAVEQAYANLQSNLENVQTANAALEQAQESLRLARLRFQAGVGTQLEVLNQVTALTNAEGNQVQAILNYNRALAQLQRSVTTRGLARR